MGVVWHVKCYFGVNEAAMRRRLADNGRFSISAADRHAGLGRGAGSQAACREKKRAEGKAGGIDRLRVDQQDGQYVLIQEQSRSLIAHLEAEGFPTEGFAKHVGHKVTVRGTSNSSGAERPVFKVRSVETISDACGPQHQEQEINLHLEETKWHPVPQRSRLRNHSKIP